MKVEERMFETGRRSAISSSELGLYSDRSDYYNRNKYGPVVKKFVIGVMAVVAVILAAIFIYDFASGATASSKVSQETKHVYILQNALKKPTYFSKRSTTVSPESDKLTSPIIQERSDSDGNLSYVDITARTDNHYENLDDEDPETRSRNLSNFKIRQKLLRIKKNYEAEDEFESKQILNNHAVVYRVRQMYKHPDSMEMPSRQDARPKPFHFEFRTPRPSSFKKNKYPQLSQYRYPHTSRNIQDIIKYLIKDPDSTKNGIKFTGVYMNPKKYDLYSDISEIMSSDQTEQSDEVASTEEDEEEEEEEEEVDTSHITITHHDPFYQYKPKHPADVNFLAPANVRYSPATSSRYHPYSEHPYIHRPLVMPSKPVISPEPLHDNTASYSGTYGKKKKPKPFSVMLDIYPITDLNDQVSNKITQRPKPAISVPLVGPVTDESSQDPRYHSHYRPDYRRPIVPYYKRGARHYSTPIPIVAIPAGQTGMSDDDEKKQMIFHLNLYPKRKSKLNRYDILKRSEGMGHDEQKEFMQKVMSPLEILTKQLSDQSAAIEHAQLSGADVPRAAALTRYQESFLEMPNEDEKKEADKNLSTNKIPDNHRIIEIKTEIAKQLLYTTEKPKESTEIIPQIAETPKNCENIIETTTVSTTTLNIDTIEGFQKFADGLVSAT